LAWAFHPVCIPAPFKSNSRVFGSLLPSFMPLGRRQRKLLLFSILGIGGLILLLLSLPLWFPWVLRPIASRFGASFERYERNSYSRFTLHQFSFTNRTVRLRAKRVDLLVPTAWSWRLAFGNIEGPFLKANDWRFQTVPGVSHTGRPTSVYRSVQDVQIALLRLRKWLPAADLSQGAVLLPDIVLDFPSASWSQGKLTAATFWPQLVFTNTPLLRLLSLKETAGPSGSSPAIAVTASLVKSPFEVHLWSDDLRLDSLIRISADTSTVTVAATGSWSSNQFKFNSQFGREGAWPKTASLEAQDLHLAGAWLRLPDYVLITGSILGTWNAGRFLLDITANGQPLARQTNLPPVKIVLHTSGDTNLITIRSATVSSPWLRADLSENARLHFQGELLRQPALLNLSLDLARQPWLPLQGTLQGQARLNPEADHWPEIHFNLTGAGIGDEQLKAGTVNVEGSLGWPWLNLSEATGTFQDGSQVSLRGRINVRERKIEEAKVFLTGTLLQRWFPRGYSCEKLTLTASANGPVKSLHHSGHLEITNLTSRLLNPMHLRADWSGTQLSLDNASLSISVPGSSLSLDGRIALASHAADLTLTNFTMMNSGQMVLALTDPFRLAMEKLSEPNQFHLRLDSFKWQGTAGCVQVDADAAWPTTGVLRGSAHNLQSTILNGFLRTKIEPFQLDALDFQVGLTNGPLAFAVNASASMRAPVPSRFNLPEQDLALSANLDLRGDGSGIVISNLVVNSQTSAVTVAHGFLPVTYHPGAPTNRFRLEIHTPFHFVAATQPQSIFWEKISGLTGLGFLAPELRLDLSGTWQAPVGTLRAQASQIKLRNSPKIPTLDDLQLSLRFDRDRVRIGECRFLVQEQPVLLTGELPLGEALWTGRSRTLDWSKAVAHLQIERAQLAALTPLFPELLAAQGELSIDLSMKPGAVFEGSLLVSHAFTRPLPSLGPIRDIELKMNLHQQAIRIDSVAATIGGAPIQAEGEADLKKINWRQPTIPPFKLFLRGTNVPLSRESDSIVRSDLNLTLTKTNDAPAILAGTAHLRDSYYLHDLADLIPGKVASPSHRPPYFSITVAPLQDWRLAVRVTGEKFLKVRSTLFNGVVSANLNVQGTLKEPLALGDVRIDSGLVRFPFASLQTQQGLVTLSSADPFRPQILLTAGAKYYGYEIKMDVNGPIDAPIIQFASTPPLTSEQIVLMVTAGELPQDMRAITVQQRAQTLAVFLGRDLLTRLGFGDESEQRLNIQSGEQLSEQGRPTYTVEYKLTNRWSLVGEYDRFNALNAGLKWKIFSR